MWLPQLAPTLSLVPLPIDVWFMILGLSAAPWTIRELSATVIRKKKTAILGLSWLLASIPLGGGNKTKVTTLSLR
jgi:hypothetical protein